MFSRILISMTLLMTSAFTPADARIVTNGFTINGFTINGFTINGFTINGAKLNGVELSGGGLNGRVIAIEF